MAHGPEFSSNAENESSPISSGPGHQGRVSVPLSKIVPWLSAAAGQGVAWVNDFGDEEICITPDLYEVIVAYQHFNQD